VLDNGLYGETGAQRSHTAHGTDLAAIARGCGIADARTITTMAEIESFATLIHSPLAGPRVGVIKIDPAEVPKVLPTRDGAYLKGRFRRALGLEAM
jgi:hypothetical protein